MGQETERGKGVVYGAGDTGQSSVVESRSAGRVTRAVRRGVRGGKATQTDGRVLPISHLCLEPGFSCPVTQG